MSTTFRTNSSSAKLLKQKTQPNTKNEEKSDEDENIVDKIQKIEVVSCITKNCNSIKQKIHNFRSKFSITSSFLTVSIIYSVLLSLTLMIVHIYLFNEVFKFDFYLAIKEEYLDTLLTNVDDLNTDLSKIEIQAQFEDLKHIFLFARIFFDELNAGVLDDLSKKYPNISHQSETLYKNLERIYFEKNVKTIFTIPKKSAYENIDNRNYDSLAELAKIYYLYFPLVSYSAFVKNTFFNQSYLIAYEVDSNKNIIGDILYFNYPRSGDEEYITDNIFTPGNSFISPKINKTCNYNFDNNQNFSNENWFIEADCNFRSSCSPLNSINLFYSHLNYLRSGQVKKSTIITLQMYLPNKDYTRNFIIHIIFYIAQKDLKSYPYDYSVFILDSFPNKRKKKFSDNKSFIITQNDIIEIAVTDFDSEYFQYGLKDKNDFFYQNGISFADYDIDKFSQPNIYYLTTDNFNFDISYLTTIFLYSELFKLTEHTSVYDEDEEMHKLIINNKENIYKVCNNFDFFTYNKHIINNNIDCWDEQNLVYFGNTTHEKAYDDYNAYPYCLCLPLYCNKNNKKNLKNVTIVDEIILPNKCQNNFKYYKNNNNSNNFFQKAQQALTSIIKKDNTDKLESEYLKFIKNDYEIYSHLKFMIVSLIDNSAKKNAINYFFNGFSRLQQIFEIIMSCGVIAMFLFSLIYIFIHVNKISKVIYDFKEKFRNSLVNFAEKTKTANNNKTNNKNNNNNYEAVANDSFEKNEDEIYENQNNILEYLFKVYCKYNNLSENQLSEIFKENVCKQKIDIKISLLKENNELFYLLYMLGLSAPRIILNIKMNHNFFANAKLNQNYLKTVSKSLSKANKEKILLSQGIIFELLSTNIIHDFGLVTNLNYNYITNFSRNKNNEIQNFFIENVTENIDQEENTSNKNNAKIIMKGKNPIMAELEKSFQSDEYLNFKELNSAFDNFIVNTCYKYFEIINKENKSYSGFDFK